MSGLAVGRGAADRTISEPNGIPVLLYTHIHTCAVESKIGPRFAFLEVKIWSKISSSFLFGLAFSKVVFCLQGE